HWLPEDLEKEKGVVAQERGEAYDTPDDQVFELHQRALYRGQPLGRPILGSEETLANVSVETLIAFRDAHMTPERTVIAIAGAFDRAPFLEMAEARFGALAAKPVLPVAPARAHAGAVGEARKPEQSHLVFSWPAPASGA